MPASPTRAAGLDDQPVVSGIEAFVDCTRQGLDIERLLLRVTDAVPTAQIEELEFDAFHPELHGEVKQFIERLEEWFHLKDLRADMTGDAANPQVARGSGEKVEFHRLVLGHAELVNNPARGNVGVRLRFHLGVNA